MLKKIDPSTTTAWQALSDHFTTVKNLHMKDLFAKDNQRFKKYSRRFNDILVDYSKNRITDETLPLLVKLAEEVDLQEAIKSMFSGEPINETENRAVFHVALRNRSNTPMKVNGNDVMPDVKAVLDKMEIFCNKIHSGQWRGHTGKRIRDIVNIGIGGSDLGPVMVTECLRPYAKPDMAVHFVSNVDGTHIAETLEGPRSRINTLYDCVQRPSPLRKP